ncbi:hypothetical protein KUCAC02_031625, partial [Chaenocephalus aceratus]
DRPLVDPSVCLRSTPELDERVFVSVSTKVDEGSGSPSNEAYGDIDLCFSRSKDLKGTGDTVKGTISDPETKNQSTQMMGRCYTSLRGFKGYVYYNWDFALAFERIAYNDIKLSKAADLSEPQHEG